jgi:hypothetical protein
MTPNSFTVSWTAPSGTPPLLYSVQYREQGSSNWLVTPETLTTSAQRGGAGHRGSESYDSAILSTDHLLQERELLVLLEWLLLGGEHGSEGSSTDADAYADPNST